MKSYEVLAFRRSRRAGDRRPMKVVYDRAKVR